MQKTSKIYTVSQINSLIKVVLEEQLPSRLIVKGEISDWKHHSSGHCYFSLKDENAVLPCVMWASKFRTVKFSPEDGMSAMATGHIDVYAAAGKYQLYVDKLEPAGVGALQLAFEQMVRKLQEEGLFDDKHKKPLPPYPMKIGILTSESGAALHDIADSILSRWPCTEMLLFPVPVQGEGAAAKIAATLSDINRRNQKLKVDVVIVARGGGSLEDLWAFNEEILARAIFKSDIPVISAVGHEIDTTIADLVADARASTPTKAGVVAVPDMMEVLANLTGIEKRLVSHVQSRLTLAYQNIETILASSIFRYPLSLIQDAEQQADDLTAELSAAIKTILTSAHQRISSGYEQIVKIEPHRLLGSKKVELNNWRNRINVGLTATINNCTMQITAQANSLTALNPKSVLKRGYSITTNKETGSLVVNPSDVSTGDLIVTELEGENLIESKVTKK